MPGLAGPRGLSPNCNLVELPRVGPIPHPEAPEQCHRRWLEFFKE